MTNRKKYVIINIEDKERAKQKAHEELRKERIKVQSGTACAGYQGRKQAYLDKTFEVLDGLYAVRKEISAEQKRREEIERARANDPLGPVYKWFDKYFEDKKNF